MSHESQTYPSWFYGPNGAADIFNDAADVPKGWKDHPSKVDALDHDGDGEKGGSSSGGGRDVLRALRAEYEDKLGKKPFPGWDEATLREKMAAA